MLFFFFFQAEDGIRDGHVTGVQTCALPISAGPFAGQSLRIRDVHRWYRRRDPARDVGDVELGDGACAAHAPADVIPEALTADAKARGDADAGDHDTRRGWGHVSIIPVACALIRPAPAAWHGRRRGSAARCLSCRWPSSPGAMASDSAAAGRPTGLRMWPRRWP